MSAATIIAEIGRIATGADALAARAALDDIGVALARAMEAVASEAQIAEAVGRAAPARATAPARLGAQSARSCPALTKLGRKMLQAGSEAALDALRGPTPRAIDRALAHAAGMQVHTMRDIVHALVRKGLVLRVHSPDGVLRYQTL